MAELLDTTKLYDLAGENRDALRPIIDKFESNSNILLQTIGAARDAGNLDELRSAAHQLKGTSSMLGMNQLFELTKSIEHLSLTDISPTLLEHMHELTQQSIQSARATLG